VQAPALRPLGAGALLDRAVTLFVRWFVPIVLVVAVVTGPVLLVQALIAPNPLTAFDLLGRIGDAGRPSAQTIQQIDAASFANVRLSLIEGLLRPLQWSALVAVVAAAYSGTRIGVGDAYRIAVRRWLPQIGVALIFLVLGAVASIPWFVAYVIVVAVVVFAATAKIAVLAIAVAVVGGLIVIVSGLLTVSWLYIAYELASVALVTEALSPVAATSAGLRRAFGAPTRVRSIVAGLVALAINFVALLPLVALSALLVELTHLQFLYWGVMGVGQVLVEGLLAAFMVVYAVDVRVRREGLDLIAAAADDAPAGTATA
jgi:hypothetical protein